MIEGRQALGFYTARPADSVVRRFLSALNKQDSRRIPLVQQDRADLETRLIQTTEEDWGDRLRPR
ncbi:MAG: hypothetical protein OXI46_05650 [Gemmatimonadota bacterium]|nr:hypothetical protein [Gemmatimonadota bacterium]